MNLEPIFSKQDHETWKILFTNQDTLREKQIIPEFSEIIGYHI